MSKHQIKYKDRKTNETLIEKVPGGNFMQFLYGQSPFGKLLLHQLFKRKFISTFIGRYMNSSLSKSRINAFIKEFNIKMDDYIIPKNGFKHFNDFFYRKIKPEARPISKDIVSPADGKILVFNKITDTKTFFIKGEYFNLITFLQNKKLAKKYHQGAMAIIRLAPVDYHRYHFHIDGIAGKNHKIKGQYFSVSPIALQKSLRVFCENKREYMEVNNDQIGDSLICDVGATMTGGIVQTYQENQLVSKGDEKGYFVFGGSTLVVLFQKNTIQFSKDIIHNTNNGLETTIKMGETIAKITKTTKTNIE